MYTYVVYTIRGELRNDHCTITMNMGVVTTNWVSAHSVYVQHVNLVRIQRTDATHQVMLEVWKDRNMVQTYSDYTKDYNFDSVPINSPSTEAGESIQNEYEAMIHRSFTNENGDKQIHGFTFHFKAPNALVAFKYADETGKSLFKDDYIRVNRLEEK